MNGEQAHRTLQELTIKANLLKAELDKTSDPTKAAELNKKFKETEAQIKDITTTMRNMNYMLANIESYTPKELQKALRDINKELSSGRIIRGTEEWNKYAEAAARVKGELEVIKEEMKMPEQGVISNIADWMAKTNIQGEVGRNNVKGIIDLVWDLSQSCSTACREDPLGLPSAEWKIIRMVPYWRFLQTG